MFCFFSFILCSLNDIAPQIIAAAEATSINPPKKPPLLANFGPIKLSIVPKTPIIMTMIAAVLSSGLRPFICVVSDAIK